MNWTLEENAIRSSDGKTLQLYPHEFWYLAPERISFSPSERNVKATDFALLMHNAVVGHGLVISMEVLLDGIESKTEKGGAAGEAERLLESTRSREFQSLPSRLRCHFLNFHRTTAEQRMHSMFRRPRSLVRCRLAGTGTMHFADVGLYEQLEGRPDDAGLARRYWQTFEPKTVAEAARLEVLANAALYFPDWREFPKVSDEVLLEWQSHHRPG